MMKLLIGKVFLKGVKRGNVNGNSFSTTGGYLFTN